MEVYELRRRNLTRILDEAGPGARQRLALRLNMTPPMVSHWLREPGKPRAREKFTRRAHGRSSKP